MNQTKINSIPSILIVDDEPPIRKILAKYLGEKKYHIQTADNGQAALQLLGETAFDLVLTDLRMPNMGGTELLQIMSERYPGIPKIVLTGYGTNDDIIIALKSGAYDFLTKPITDFKILEHAIERGIDRKRINDEKNRYFEQLNHINEIVSMLNSGKSTEDIFNMLNINLRKIIPFNRLALASIDKEMNTFSAKLVSSDRDIILGANESFSLSESSLQNVISDKKYFYIPDIEEYLVSHPQSKASGLLLQEGMNSSLVMPLLVNNQIRGFLIFASVLKDAFNDEHIDFLESIVGQIALSVQRGELIYEIEQHTKNLERMVELRSRQIVKTQKTTIYALSRLAETRDPETGEHLDRMRNYCVLIAQIYKYVGNHKEITNQFLRDLYDSSILHDIGKVGIPDGILLKEGFLTEHEFDVIKSHTTIGYNALRTATSELGEDSFLKMAMDVTLYHHERWDGKGYPKGLSKEDIPISARIVSIADVYDALTTKRPYKEGFSHEKSIEIMKQESHRYDPEIFKIFVDNAEEFNKVRIQIGSN